MHQNPFPAGDPAGGAYDAPPDPLVGWEEGYPLPIPLPARLLRRLEFVAYGASILRPPQVNTKSCLRQCAPYPAEELTALPQT